MPCTNKVNAVTQAAFRPRLSFEEYVDFCAQTNERYELVHGELKKITPATWQHILIAQFLEQSFNSEIKRLQAAWIAIRESGQRTEQDSSRLPDVSVIPFEEIAKFLKQTAIIDIPAFLVVEIVSPSSAAEDYGAKLGEYQTIKVPECWIVDCEALGAAKHLGFPKMPTITVNQLAENGIYESQQFRGSDRIISKTFPECQLTVEEIFRMGR